jgi:hypothetical protein
MAGGAICCKIPAGLREALWCISEVPAAFDAIYRGWLDKEKSAHLFANICTQSQML